MRNKIIIIVFIIISIFISYLIGSKIQINNYNKQMITLENNIKNLKIQHQKDITEMVSNNIMLENQYKIAIKDLESRISDLSSSSIVADEIDIHYLIEGSLKDLPSDLTTLIYKNHVFVPIDFIATEMGSTFNISENWLEIGRPIFTEKFIASELMISDESSPNEIEFLLGSTLDSQTYVNECTGNIESRYEYDGVTIISGRMFEVNKPVIATMRGITIGSTEAEVLEAYGNPNSYGSYDNKWVYGTYKAGLWFIFNAEGKVESFKKYIIDC